MTAIVAGKADSGLLFGHPKGLYVLSLTETWERFSYYGMRALLVLYLTRRFLIADSQSFAIYGAYTALVYISPLLGGAIADRFFGYNKSVLLGACLMIVGHFGLAFQDFYYAHGAAVDDARGLQVFYVSIAFLITGVGFLKGNISTMVGDLYPRDSQLRDSGFIIFFWGVNIGATLAAFTCGYVGEKYGWEYGFGLAGLGMCAGLATFLLGQPYLKNADRPPTQPVWRIAGRRLPNWLLPLVGILITLPLSWGLMQLPGVTGDIVYLSVAAAFAWAIIYALRNLDSNERERMWCAFIVWAIWACYAALIEQTGSSLNLFTERLVDRHVGPGAGMEIQASQFQGLTTLFILLLSPLFAWTWSLLDRRGRNPTTPAKLSLAILALAAGFGFLMLGTALPDSGGRVGLIWLVLNYLCFSVAAIIIQPIGLSAYTRLSPTPIVGFMVGLWMLAVAIGSFLAAQIAKLSALDKAVQQAMPAAALLAHYQKFFATLALSAILLGLVFFALTPLMRRWMHGMR